MAAEFMIRDLLFPRRVILEEVGLRPGMCVLDYGCGPGSYVAAAAQMVGETGKVYALDMHPLAMARVRRLCARKRLANVVTIFSDCKTGLADGEADVALLYDVLHDLDDPGPVLRELHRVLKCDGALSVSDHRLGDEQTVSILTRDGLFRLGRPGKRSQTFHPVKPTPSGSG